MSAFNQLVIRKFSTLAVPDGGGIANALEILTDPNEMKSLMQDAKDWVEEAIAVVKTSPDNPYQTDEEICQVILDRLDERTKLINGKISSRRPG